MSTSDKFKAEDRVKLKKGSTAKLDGIALVLNYSKVPDNSTKKIVHVRNKERRSALYFENDLVLVIE